ncbi:MAG: hypothetical protein KTR32_24030 [Granulosicoccus sp.]|nr:hypothetical protein [Granulosicoccus sp.]
MTKNVPHSVWTTSNDCWDDFLNDPTLTQQIETARKSQKKRSGVQTALPVRTDASIGQRLLAYETPITDEILRQSIA